LSIARNGGGRANEPWVRVTDPPRALDVANCERIVELLSSAKSPLLVCGPQYDGDLAESLATLADVTGAPVLADPLSQLRWGKHDRSHVIDRYDAMLRHPAFAQSVTPDFVVRVGGAPTSKVALQYIASIDATQIVIDEAGWPDPTLMAGEVVHATPRLVCEQIAAALRGKHAETKWLDRWVRANDAAGAALEHYTCTLSETFEGRAIADIVSTAPDGATIFVSSSMPVRDLDSFGGGHDRRLRILSNRGANGIDGVVSTALGAAAASDGPLILVIGDLALYHDMNGLLAAKLHHVDATVVVLNNDGGGIFSFLPQAVHREHFEKLFGTPHGLDFAHVAALYEGRYARAMDSQSLQRALSYAIGNSGWSLIEMRTDRERNVTLHREAWAAVAAALDNI
jgi:2-succinyl-5-enolpyruvyl-6-hydroxy-3-cyclohexene-1-carboxylate synthase